MEKIASCKCGAKYRLPVTYFGKSFTCTKCGQIVEITPVKVQKTIAVMCPSCSRTLRVAERLIGKHFRCLYCGTKFPVELPPPQPQPPAPPPEEGTKRCPFCDELIQEEAKVCRHCQSRLYKTCPYCAEEISAVAKKCKHCGSMLKPLKYAEKTLPSALIGPKRGILAWGFFLLGLPVLLVFTLLCYILTSRTVHVHARDIAVMLPIWAGLIILWIILVYVFLYKVGTDIKRHYTKSTLNPGLYVVLLIILSVLSNILRTQETITPRIICTVGQLIFIMYIMYKYARETYEMFVEDEKPAADHSIICLLLGFFCFPVSLLIIQSQLNRHWEIHEQSTSGI